MDALSYDLARLSFQTNREVKYQQDIARNLNHKVFFSVVNERASKVVVTPIFERLLGDCAFKVIQRKLHSGSGSDA